MSYSEQIQNIVQRYIDDGHKWPAAPGEIAEWANEHGQWEPQRTDKVKLLARQISQAMREEYITDPQGRRVRAKHVFRKEKDGKQTYLWTDIRVGTRDQMQLSFQQRRQHIKGECRQLKTDVDSYNDNLNTGEPIQMVFDFTRDLEEMELEAIEV